MTTRARSAASQMRHRGHLGRTLATLGAIVFFAVTIGLASEIYLRAFHNASGDIQMASTSLLGTLSLALVSVQAVLPLIGALVAAPVLLARFLHDLHGTGTISEAHERLNELLFGALRVRRRIVVSEGKTKSGDDRVIRRVGGPAILTVFSDSAVVTERGGCLARVLAVGTHTLDRYERIWETVDLRPQRWVREVFALTKEGIPISCDVDVLFKIETQSQRELGRRWRNDSHRHGTTQNSRETILQAAVSRWISTEGKHSQSMNWADRVAALIESELRDILARYRLDWLIRAPQSKQQHPRDEIRQRLQAALANQLHQVGAEVLSVDLGQMRVKIQHTDRSEDREVSDTLSQIISGQWLDAWHADWKAQALTSRAEGEAELLRMDTARIEAQAEMIIGLAEALQSAVTNVPESMPYVVALRLVEALRGMSYDPSTLDYMPPEVMRTLRRLQQLLESEAAFSGEGTPSERGGDNA